MAGPVPAHAAGVGLAPYFVEYGTGMSTSVGQNGSTSVPVGVMTYGSGTATGVTLTVDLSDISDKVDIVGVSSPCSRSGSTVTCTFGTLNINGEKKVGATLFLRAKPTATAGSAGKVYLRLTSNPAPTTATTTGTVEVWPDVADMVMTSTVPVARVGQTVTVSHTVKNNGPALQPWVILRVSSALPGIQYVGGNGCTTTSSTFECRIENIAVGQTRVVTVAVKVTGCGQGAQGPNISWGAAISDPNHFNNAFGMRVRVEGCTGSSGSSSGSGSGSGSGTGSRSSGGSGSGSGSGSASVPVNGADSDSASDPALSATVQPAIAEPVASPSRQTVAPNTSKVPVAVEAVASSSGISTTWLVTVTALGLTALAGLIWHRRRRQVGPETADPPATE